MSRSAPNRGEVSAALGGDLAPEVFEAEVADQASRCHVEPYNHALFAALVRRCARATELRNLPLGVMPGEAGNTYIGSNDPEVRRLEAPYRRLVIG